MRVFLDIGHGPRNGKGGSFDPGAMANGETEYSVVRETVERIPTRIQSRISTDHGIEIIKTPELSIHDLAEWVNARVEDEDLFLTVHMNASTNAASTGVEVIYCDTAPDIRAHLSEKLANTVAAALKLKSRGAIEDARTPRKKIGILHQVKIPAYLLEIGFLTNPKDLESVRKFGSLAICEGIRVLYA